MRNVAGTLRNGPALDGESRDARDISKLLCLCTLSFVTLGIFIAWIFQADASHTAHFLARQDTTPPRSENRALTIAGIAFGMTAGRVERVRPNVSFQRDGATVRGGSFKSDGVTYRLWFLGQGENARVYRMRYQQTFRQYSEDTVLGEFGRRFGRPATSQCARKIFGGHLSCRFQWWTADGVALEVESRAVKGARNGKGAVVSVTALDTYLTGKQRRARARELSKERRQRSL